MLAWKIFIDQLTEEEAKQFRDLKTEQLVLTADYNKKTADANAKAAEEAKKKRDEDNKQAIWKWCKVLVVLAERAAGLRA